MKLPFDRFYRYETPQIFLCNPGCVLRNDLTLSSALGVLPDTEAMELILNFNAISELNFRAYKIKHPNNTEANTTAVKLYKGLLNRRLLYVDGVGFFVISNVTEGYDGVTYYKDVKAQSIELEIQNRLLTYVEDGTYRFDELMNKIIETLPNWIVGVVDSSVREKYRTFEDTATDMNVLGFMLEKMQEAYECIFIFDIIRRRINVYDQNTYVTRTSIHLTPDDFITEVSVDENADELYTALRVFGDGELSINAVNPLGTGVIYNFDYYRDWMSPGLQAKLSAWEALVEREFPIYSRDNREYYEILTTQRNQQAEMDKLSTQITMYTRCRDNIVAEKDTLSVDGYNQIIVQYGGEPIEIAEELADTLAYIDNLMADAQTKYDRALAIKDSWNRRRDELIADINFIHGLVDLQTYFGSDMEELQHYIYEGTYTDGYITVTESMSYSEQFEQMNTLYTRAIEQLKRISSPAQEFTVNVENFVFKREFEDWAAELVPGSLISVELDEDDVAELFLATVTINFDDRELSLKFGNRFNKYDTKSLFDDVLGKIQKSANSVEYMKDILYPVKNGELDEMQEAIRNSRTLTKNDVLSARQEQVVIDDTGYTGRRVFENGEADPHQVKLTGRTLAFTDDAWETAKVALGQIIIDNDQTAYGINAETIIGEMIIGNGLSISTQDEQGQKKNIFEIMDGKVTSGISDVEGRVSTLEQTADGVNISIRNIQEELGKDVDHVTTTTGYTFDANGLTIQKDGQEMRNILDNTGMYVKRDNDNILVANNEGVEALNLTTNQYLTINGVSRFESYTTSTGQKRTACFYVG